MHPELIAELNMEKYIMSPTDFIDMWLQQMAGAIGRGGWYKGAYRIKDVKPICEELVRLGDEIK